MRNDVNDPRFEPTPGPPKVLADVIAIDCHDDRGNLVTRKVIAFDYFDTGDGWDVRVSNAGIFREDAMIAIGEILKTRVSVWDFVG